ncbi:MAG: glutamate-5-semialdehyde dehydrogenase [Candidatus Latescibacter sp.]|nr:glutamate-5-semialdehyde dehydrogenase [Candidatus Latescibacter sp.]
MIRRKDAVMDNVFDHVMEKARKAKNAAGKMAGLSGAVKDSALHAMADSIMDNRAAISSANAKDLELSDHYGLSKAAVDRLTLTDSRIEAMAKGLREVASFPDPVGIVTNMVQRSSGIRVGKMTVPIGLIGFIYESRPNVTVDAAGLVLKSGNAILLRGGKEAIHSNIALAALLSEAAASKGIPEGAISIIEMTDREGVRHMVEAAGVVDLVIPRGGKGLIKTVVDLAKVPVIKHYEGNCHVFVDLTANLDDALNIIVNAKTQRPGVCNAAEKLLVHSGIAGEFIPRAAKALTVLGVELRGCPRARALVPEMKEAVEDDWYTEYLDLILGVKVVDSVEEAVTHINTYSSKHTDAIVTSDILSADYFVMNVDSSSVMVNASTRFSDGGEYGLGAEIGISTDKLHARGPMGLAELTTYKWVVYGQGSVRE